MRDAYGLRDVRVRFACLISSENNFAELRGGRDVVLLETPGVLFRPAVLRKEARAFDTDYPRTRTAMSVRAFRWSSVQIKNSNKEHEEHEGREDHEEERSPS